MKPLDCPYLYIQTSGLSVNGIAKSAMSLLYQVFVLIIVSFRLNNGMIEAPTVEFNLNDNIPNEVTTAIHG